MDQPSEHVPVVVYFFGELFAGAVAFERIPIGYNVRNEKEYTAA